LGVRVRAIRCAVLVALLTVACRATAPGSKADGDDGAISSPPRSVVIKDDRVVIEGRWYPIEVPPTSPVITNAVRVVCVRGERSCQEDLTRLSTYPGGEPVHDLLKYRIEEWTPADKPAGKLVASRREGATRVEIRVSLSGLAAEKVVMQNEGETHWRLE
jgi:hypothetical protein